MKKFVINTSDEDGANIKTDIIDFEKIIVFHYDEEAQTMRLVLSSEISLSYENIDRRTFDQISNGVLSEVTLVEMTSSMDVEFI